MNRDLDVMCSGQTTIVDHNSLGNMSKLKKALDRIRIERGDAISSLMNHYDGLSQKKDKAREGRARREIDIQYSTTKMYPVAHKRLIRKKIFALDRESATNEQIRTLRTQLLDRLNKINGNSLVVTSSNPYEGKTFTTVNLGVSISQELDRTVVIIDADLKKPSLRRKQYVDSYFGIKSKKGLSDFLRGKAALPDLLVNPGINKLTVLPGGSNLPNSAELLGSPRMESLISEMKNRYPERIIIIDTPPANKYADAMILSKYVDGVLMVAEEESTSEEDLRSVFALLKDSSILGIILNKSKP